ncbi:MULTISPECIES: hypothetical protein [Pseudomonas]|uniref:hypothetical protein n=1 Tax=Pseudomonas TaxID=286 RepID=UPI0015A8A031|nr:MULTISPECIES: hypothetical protein [Pseudomonas]
MKIEQKNTQSMPALLRNNCGVDAQKTKSLCCKAAGIIDSISATAEALIPHEKLREAASVDATLIARERPPAQPVVGYKPFPSDERAEYEKEFPVPEGLQYCANLDTYIRAAGSSPSDKFAREHYAYRAGFAAWMRRAWKQVSTDLTTERGDGFTCWGTKTQPSAVPLTAQTTHQFIANQVAALTDTFRAYTEEETAWCAIKAEELELLKQAQAERDALQADLTKTDQRVDEFEGLLQETISAWAATQFGDPPTELAKVIARIKPALNPTQKPNACCDSCSAGGTRQDVVDANNAIKEAQLSLIAVLKDVYPVGTRVKANLGRSMVTVEITGHSNSYWYGAGDLTGFNVKTGSVRRFHFSAIQEAAAPLYRPGNAQEASA